MTLDDGAFRLRFVEGRPIVEPGAGRRLVLNGTRARNEVQLLIGDVLEAEGDGLATAKLVVEAGSPG